MKKCFKSLHSFFIIYTFHELYFTWEQELGEGVKRHIFHLLVYSLDTHSRAGAG